MEEGHVNGFILGDSGYRCTPWLMTPLLQPNGAAERRYNAAHKKTRVLVEQSIGRWKRRFHVLHTENRMHCGYSQAEGRKETTEMELSH